MNKNAVLTSIESINRTIKNVAKIILKIWSFLFRNPRVNACDRLHSVQGTDCGLDDIGISLLFT
jgi:hypothetical protein